MVTTHCKKFCCRFLHLKVIPKDRFPIRVGGGVGFPPLVLVVLVLVIDVVVRSDTRCNVSNRVLG